MAIEQGQTGSEDYTVLMESDSGSRLRTEGRSLRKHEWCGHFMTVCLCLTCCLLMHMYLAFTSGRKDNEVLRSPSFGMQKQTLESLSSDETSQQQRFAPFIRLTTGNRVLAGEGYVPWRLTGDSRDHAEFFTLDSDGESLIVLRDGTYKLSLQIMYRGVSGRHYDKTVLWHEIHNRPAGYPKNLTMLIYMETVNFTFHTWTKTLFSEGVYSLKNGDRLKVFSKDRSLLNVGGQVSEKTFFVAHPHLVSKSVS